MFDNIYTWFNSLNVNVRVIIGAFSMGLFGSLMVNLFDLIVNGEANW